MSEPTPEDPRLLASPSDLALLLHADAADPLLALALRRASSRFEDAIGYPVLTVTDDVVLLSGDGSRRLLLPARPVQGTPTVRVDGEPVTDFQVARFAARLERACGWPAGLDNVEVTYTHGWDEVPGGIEDAVLEQAEATYNVMAGVASVTSGREARTFLSQAAVGVTQRWAEAVARYAIRGGDA